MSIQIKQQNIDDVSAVIQWLKACCVKMGARKRKVFLFSDCCPAYPLMEFNNTELIFLPAVTTSACTTFGPGGDKICKT
jgi:hypothetical protein